MKKTLNQLPKPISNQTVRPKNTTNRPSSLRPSTSSDVRASHPSASLERIPRKTTLRKVSHRSRKVPEALPKEQFKESAFAKLKATVFRSRPAIQQVVREPTAGGIVFRLTKDKKDIEILLIQDSKNRWTIPKGHIEVGETAKFTAIREIGEEAGLFHISVLGWLGKIHFKYRRGDKLVLMTTQIYLVRSLDYTEKPTKEDWMKGIKWFKFSDALDAIEYEDIEKLMLIAKKRIRQGDFQ